MPPPQPSGQDQIPSQKMSRPAAIEVDLWEMDRRKRVREVLGASDFCGELEQIIQSEIAKSYPENLNSVLQRSEQNLFAAPTTICFTGPQFLPHLPSLNVNQVLSTPTIPIADLSSQYLVEERRSRNKLATLYRLVDLFQWSQGIYNHITLRLPNTTDSAQILINPFGLLYHEITASSLIKLTLHGEVLDQGTTNLGVNQAAYVLHSAIHEARPDVHCVLHLHTAVVAAVASMRCGLLPICQEALIIGPVAYHDYQGILTDEEEKKSIVRDLGEKNVMILRNHGFVACGQSVEDALHLAFHTIIACETQIRAARVGIDNLIVPSEEAAKRAYETARRGGGGVNRINNNANQIENGQKQGNEQSKNFSYTTRTSWNIGELEWEAWCRVLDSSGFCTGHIYRNPQLRPAPPTYHSMYNLASIASLPNGPTSIGAINESEGVANWRLSMLRKEKERARWLNSPNQYQKMHILETGTAHPRVVTRWVEQSARNTTEMIGGGTTVKIDSPHQFSPCGTDNKEFKEQQRRLKQLRMAGTISPGPKSQLLERMTLDTTHNVVPAEKENDERSDAEWLQNNSKRPIYIGTASKGIIQRNQQMNAQVYRQLYAPNPFNTKSDDDLKKYLREVEEKKYKSQVIVNTANSMPASPILKKLPESPSTDRASLAQAVARIKLNKEQHARSASEDGANQLSRDNEKFICEAIEANHGKENKKKGKKRRGIFFFGRKKSS